MSKLTLKNVYTTPALLTAGRGKFARINQTNEIRHEFERFYGILCGRSIAQGNF
jgi:hypothetical protein